MPKRVRTTAEALSQKELNLYKKSYKGGGRKDIHFAIFEGVKTWITKETNDTVYRVLYPGCHRHLTASLIFPHVDYVDYDKKVAALYHDAAAAQYVETNKIYDQEAIYTFRCRNVDKPISALLPGNFDLIISLSAGIMAEPCTPYVKQHGYLLVNDAHSDAKMAFTSDIWELKAYWQDGAFEDTLLAECFQAKDKKSGQVGPLSRKQAEEGVSIGSVNKRSYKLLFDPMFYLFQKKLRNNL